MSLDSGAWTAVATFALAGVTVCGILVALHSTRAERRRDADKRAEDRAFAEQQRTRDYEQAERLRAAERAEAERLRAAERADREDFEARQVLVTVEPKDEGEFTHLITVSSPHAYPITRIAACVAWPASRSNAGVDESPVGSDPYIDPYIDRERTYYSFRARLRLEFHDRPLIRFVDWRGNLYYQYRGYTMRFRQNDGFLDALMRITEFIGRGPEPD